MKWKGGLRLSWGGLIVSITVALFTRDKQDTLIERYGTLEVTMEQIMNLKEEDELEDRGSLGTRKMVDGW